MLRIRDSIVYPYRYGIICEPSLTNFEQILQKALFLHIVYPQSFFRTSLFGTLIILTGYTYENSYISSQALLLRFLMVHGLCCALISGLKLHWVELKGLEISTLTCLQCLYHYENPKVDPKSISDAWLRTGAFQIEPRFFIC